MLLILAFQFIPGLHTGKALGGFNQVFKCQRFSETDKESCFAKIAIQENKINICQKINSRMIRDNCYFRMILKDFWKDQTHFKYMLSPIDKDRIRQIDNGYLKYIAHRFPYRPHMVQRILGRLSRRTYKFTNTLKQCSFFQEETYLRCLFTEAAKLGRYKPKESRAICSSIENLETRSECLYFSFLSVMMGMREDLPKFYKMSLGVCESIPDTFWKAECFYTIADEVALSKFDKDTFERIGHSCMKVESIDTQFLHCFDHVAKQFTANKIDFLKYILDKIQCEDKANIYGPCKSIDNSIKIIFSRMGDQIGGELVKVGSSVPAAYPKIYKACTNINPVKKRSKLIQKCVKRGIVTVVTAASKVTTWQTLNNQCKALQEPFAETCLSAMVRAVTNFDNLNIDIHKCDIWDDPRLLDLCYSIAIFNFVRNGEIGDWNVNPTTLKKRISQKCQLFPKKVQTRCYKKFQTRLDWMSRQRGS